MYRVKLDVFEGPLDLLVYLIEKAEMDIYDIEIAEITRQYIKYIEDMQKLNVSLAQEFMVMAAGLLEVKSKMLLPRSEPVFELYEEEDPRSELREKLLEYKRFKEAAKYFAEREELMQNVFSKPKEDLQQFAGEEDEYLKLEIGEFLTVFKQFLERSKRVEEVRKHYTRLERVRLSLEMKIESIFNFFKKTFRKTVLFRELIEKEEDKYDTVLTFSSVLQMMKDGQLDAEQDYAFGDISLSVLDKKEV